MIVNQKINNINCYNECKDDISTETLNKVAQDLSKMIKKVCDTKKKPKQLNFKISKNLINKNVNLNIKPR